MIVDLKKYLFIGAKENLDAFFNKAQEEGFLEFITVGSKKAVEHSQEVDTLLAAMKTLRKLPVKKPYDRGGDLAFAQQIAHRILQLKDEIEKFHEQQRLLEAEIVRVGIFGDFSMEDIDYIEQEGHRKIQFFCMKTAKSNKVEIPEEMIYIGTEFDLDYFMAINKEPKHYPDMIEMRIDRPLGELENQLAFVKETLHQIEAELKGYAGHMEFLHEAMIEELNLYNLARVKREASFPMQNSLFTIEAWVPENKQTQLYSLVDKMAVHCEEIAIEETDRVPTCMDNKGLAKIGEDLVKIYDTPSTQDKDPSMWVLCAFALFFAIIIADAGYGLIYLAIAAFIKYKVPVMKGMMKRVYKLFVILACSCVVWGVLTASYFGVNINPDSPLGKVSVINYLAKKKIDYDMRAHSNPVGTSSVITYEQLPEYNRTIILEFSLMIGVIHISLALLRYLRRNWAGIGWIIFMIGGYLYFPSILKATSMINVLGIVDTKTATHYGIEMIYFGFGSAIVLALIQHKWNGLKEIANLVQIFADVLSYLRLYALALASSIMAETFNGIGAYIGFFAGLVAMLVGHSANIILGTGSGVIHGLRLNFIEWYHYCFIGGGRLFNPLVKLKAK